MKSSVWDFVVTAALMLSFAMMRVDLITVLLFVFWFLLVQGYGIYYRCKHEGAM